MNLSEPIPPLPGGRIRPKRTHAEVMELCRRYAEGESSRQVADALDISHSQVLGILHGEWLVRAPTSFTADGTPVLERPAIRPVVKLSAEDALEIKRLYAAGWLQREIADAFEITQPHVSKILSGARWVAQSHRRPQKAVLSASAPSP